MKKTCAKMLTTVLIATVTSSMYTVNNVICRDYLFS